LPQLRRLVLTGHEKQESIDNEIYGQRRMVTRITQLGKLAKNCPKLLRFYGTKFCAGWPQPFIFAQRPDAASKFRIVRPVQKTVDGDSLGFDYDSVESCSSDEC
jgi:hypothetical protein